MSGFASTLPRPISLEFSTSLILNTNNTNCFNVAELGNIFFYLRAVVMNNFLKKKLKRLAPDLDH